MPDDGSAPVMDLRMLAAWLEGEGCFQAYERNGCLSLAISAASTDLDTLGHVIAFAGGFIASVKRAQPHHKPCWTWKLGGRCEVLSMAVALRPLMLSARRRAAIDRMLALAERHPERKRYARTAPHGTTTRYRNGCRCDDCRAASTAYVLARNRRLGVPPRVKHRYCKRGHDQHVPANVRPKGKGCAACHRDLERSRRRA